VTAGAPISQYWDTAQVPAYILEICDSFKAHNPSLPHRLFSEADAERLIAERFGERQLRAFKACAIPSMQSDYFRYCAVYALGGVYADVDWVCAGPLSPLVNRVEAGELFASPTLRNFGGREARWIWSGFFAFREPRHPFLGLALEIATVNMEERLAERLWPIGERVVENIWHTVGPGIPTFLTVLRDHGSFDAVIDAVAGQPAEPFARLNCEVVGDYDRVVEAFEGVRIASHEEMCEWVRAPEEDLPYKDTEAHWKNAKTSIFR
jgi:hypothetical protein